MKANGYRRERRRHQECHEHHEHHGCDACPTRKVCGYVPSCDDFDLFSEVKFAEQLKLLVNKHCLSNTLLALSDNGVEIQGHSILKAHGLYHVSLLLCNREAAETILGPLIGCNIKKLKVTSGLVLRLADLEVPRSEVLTRLTHALECAGISLLESYWTVRDCELFIHTSDDVAAGELFTQDDVTDYCLGDIGEQEPADCVIVPGDEPIGEE